MKHFAIVAGLVVVVTGVVAFGLSNAELLPVLASEEGKIVDDLFDLHLYAIAFLFALIAVFMVYSIVVFRRKPGEDGDGDYFHGHTGLEIVWTIIPLATVLYFSYLGAVTLEETMQPEENELVVEVTSFQFGWKFNYPQYGENGIQSTELMLPNNRQVQFKLYATDVIHSFWIPEFRVKQDAVPGHEKQIRIKPTRLGHYRVRCAELCGTSHALMLAEVNVVEPTEFEAWVEEFSGEVDLTELGARNAAVCIACHSTDGSDGVGPTWLGLYNSERTLDDGTTVTADEEYLRKAILIPGEEIVSGFANVMPEGYGDTFSEQEVDAFIEYIKSLADGEGSVSEAEPVEEEVEVEAEESETEEEAETEAESETEEEADSSAESDLAEAGKVAAASCIACHSADGTETIGPTWQGLYNAERTLADGTTVTADDEYLRTAILSPGDQVVEGFVGGLMPDYKDLLSDEDVDAIIEYIKTLK